MKKLVIATMASLLLTQSASAAPVLHYDRTVSRYTNDSLADCTGEMVHYKSVAVVQDITISSKKGTRNRFSITVRSKGIGVSSGLRYRGREKAVVVTANANGTIDQVIDINISYKAQGVAPDFISHQYLHLFTNAQGEMTIVAEESKSECVL